MKTQREPKAGRKGADPESPTSAKSPNPSPSTFEDMFLGIITAAVENAVGPRFDAMDKRFDAVERELASLSLNMTKRFDAVEDRLDAVEVQLKERS